jgi:hypothetical protein
MYLQSQIDFAMGRRMAFFGSGLVVRRKVFANLNNAAGGAPPAAVGTGDVNLSNILKLVPGDIVAIYLTGQGLYEAKTKVMGVEWPLLLCILCLIVCILLRVLVTAKAPGGINWLLVAVSALAFFIWAHAVAATSGPVVPGFNGSFAGLVAMLFGIIAPKLVPAQPE